MTNQVPPSITTEAGARLWTYLNQAHDPGTWGLAGKIIPEIEQEERDRIIALLEAEIENPADTYVPNEFDPVDWYDGWASGVRDAIALIKGENNG